MPSLKTPTTTINAGPGPRPEGTVSGGSAEAGLLAHINDPVGAHAATAISTTLGPAWADATTNPAADAQTQLNKIVNDLGTGAGAAKIHYNASPLGFADSTGLAAGTLEASVDSLVNILGAIGTPDGATKIGVRAITNSTITIAAGTLRSTILSLSLASNIQYLSTGVSLLGGTALADNSTKGTIDAIVTAYNSQTSTSSGARNIGIEARATWITDGATNPATDTFTAIKKIIDDLNLQSVGHSGADKIGCAQMPTWIDGTVHLTGSIFTAISTIITDLSTQTAFTSGASKIGISARSNWLDGTTNPATDTDTAAAKIITDLSRQTIPDGAGIVGAGASGTLTSSTVGGHIFSLDDRSSRTANLLAVNAFQNFAVPGDNHGSIATSGNVVGSAVSAGWAVEKRMLFANNTVTVFASYDGGYTWTTEATTVMTHADFVANGQTSALAIGAVAGAGSCRPYGSLNNAGGSNSTLPASGTPSVNRVRPDPYQTDTFWVVGFDSSGAGSGSIWKVVTVNGVSPPTMTQAIVTGTGSTSTLSLVAPGKTTILATNGTQIYAFSPSSPVAVGPQTSPTATAIVDLFWVDSISKFLLIASSGPSSLEFWSSSTGLTGSWGNLSVASLSTTYSALTGAGVSFTNVISGFPGVTGTNQSIVAIPVRLASGSVWDIAFTYDGGFSWKLIPDPLAMHQTPSPKPTIQRVSLINNRLMAYAYQAAGTVYHALSSRTGNP